MKKGLWTEDEDAFLMRWHGIGIDFIAPHDLDRSTQSARKRLKHLTENGAREAFCEMAIGRIKFWLLRRKAGELEQGLAEDELSYWESEYAAARFEREAA